MSMLRSNAGAALIGSQTPTSRIGTGPRKPSCATPTTVNGEPFKTIVLPTIAESPAKYRIQVLWLKIATRCVPGVRSSSGRKSRPMAGLTPTMRKYSAETRKLMNSRLD